MEDDDRRFRVRFAPGKEKASPEEAEAAVMKTVILPGVRKRLAAGASVSDADTDSDADGCSKK